MLVVITGPSGVGKTTIIESLLDSDPGLLYSRSLTTRQPRPDKREEFYYRFISPEEFQQKINDGEFVEWSEVYGKYYGRLKKDLDDLMSHGDVVIGIDPQGAAKLQSEYPEGIFIFLLPRSKVALEAQLRGRKTDDEDSIRTRLKTALQEMEMADAFEYRVVNDSIKETVKEVQAIIDKRRKAVSD